MLIPSRDVPQADVLSKVVGTVEAVAEGATTYQGIAHAIGEMKERQGRYYRLAGELLDFIYNIKGKNQALLTTKGKQFINSNSEDRKKLLASAVLQSRMIQRVLPFLESKGSIGGTRSDLTSFVETVTQRASPVTIARRVATIVNWLTVIGMLEKRNRTYVLRGMPPHVETIRYETPEEPLFPQKYDLKEYKQASIRAKKERRNITLLVNEAAQERANESHRMLTGLVAKKVRQAGGIPREHKFIDLATKLSNEVYIFEMKSATRTNFLTQVRKAIPQLYEYRYRQQIPRAKLVLVTECPPPKQLGWIIDYVVKDRGLLLAWDGDRRTLHCPPETGDELDFIT